MNTPNNRTDWLALGREICAPNAGNVAKAAKPVASDRIVQFMLTYADFLGFQEFGPGLPTLELWNVKKALPGLCLNTTTTRETLIAAIEALHGKEAPTAISKGAEFASLRAVVESPRAKRAFRAPDLPPTFSMTLESGLEVDVFAYFVRGEPGSAGVCDCVEIDGIMNAATGEPVDVSDDEMAEIRYEAEKRVLEYEN